MNPIKAYFDNWAFWVRLVFVGIMTGIGIVLHELWPVETHWHFYIGGMGSFCYLFGDYLTGSGFHAGYGFHRSFVGTSTPTAAWRIAALIFWGIALAVFIGSQP